MASRLKAPTGKAAPYEILIGTGGIGHGYLFDLEGDDTLGREESRAARLREARDYCKLHIIAHYPAVLLPPPFRVVPVGAVGNDEPGARLLREMNGAGMDTTLVRTIERTPTTLSVCFQYPDGTGGNLTAADAASARVTPADIERARPLFERHRGRGIALAAPEVPLDARAALLEMATEYGFFRATSFTPGEIREAIATGLFHHLDLVSINMEEARALLGAAPGAPLRGVLPAAMQVLRRNQPACQIIVTNGERGAYGLEPAADAMKTHFVHARPAAVLGTAGAGDAFLAGLLTGLAAGLGFADRLEFANLLASAKVESEHTIHPGLDADALRRHAEVTGPLPQAVSRLL